MPDQTMSMHSCATCLGVFLGGLDSEQLNLTETSAATAATKAATTAIVEIGCWLWTDFVFLCSINVFIVSYLVI